MENIIDLERQLDKLKKNISSIEITQEFIELTRKMSEITQIQQKITIIKWNSLPLNEKIKNRKENLLLTRKYYEKFKDEVKLIYLFKKKYVQLVDNIIELKDETPLMLVLLKSLNTSLYIDFSNKDFNLKFIVEALQKNENSNDITNILNSYQQLFDFYNSNSSFLKKDIL